jgi:hypothetical protein
MPFLISISTLIFFTKKFLPLSIHLPFLLSVLWFSYLFQDILITEHFSAFLFRHAFLNLDQYFWFSSPKSFYLSPYTCLSYSQYFDFLTCFRIFCSRSSFCLSRHSLGFVISTFSGSPVEVCDSCIVTKYITSESSWVTNLKIETHQVTI